jgi:hypothetical protein
MDFIKKHYEKVLLGVVLVGLAVAVGFLLIKINSEKQKLDDLSNSLIHAKPKPLPTLELAQSEASLKRMNVPLTLDFSSSNRVFNPMPWQQTRDTPPRLIPVTKVGPVGATVTNITALYLRISLDSVNAPPDGPARYVLGVEKESASTADKRKKKQFYSSIGDKNETFQLLGVKGPPESPTNVFVLLDTGETNMVSKDAPFRRIDGYKATLRYDPEKKGWNDQRIGASLMFNGEEYKIVAITQNEVVLSAPNQKKWTIKLNPAT